MKAATLTAKERGVLQRSRSIRSSDGDDDEEHLTRNTVPIVSTVQDSSHSGKNKIKIK